MCLTIDEFISIPAVKKGKKHIPRKKRATLIFPHVSLYVAILSCVVLVVIYVLKPFQNEVFCANSISCIKDLSGAFDTKATTGIFRGKIVTSPSTLAKGPFVSANAVLGDNTDGNKHIYIDLTNQKLYAKEGDITAYEFPVSTGLWGQTPTGDFKIWIKLRYTRMKGGNKALGTYYDLPNVPYTMYFYNDEIPKTRGYGIHGAYWHNNFGRPMSHGCVNMRIEDVEKIYYWADPDASNSSVVYTTKDNPSTPITIYGVAPDS